jgi:hypothetical protein
MQLNCYRSYQSAANAQIDLTQKLLNYIPQLMRGTGAKNNLLVLSLISLVADVTVETAIAALGLTRKYIREEQGDAQLEWWVVCMSATVTVSDKEKLTYMRALDAYVRVSTFPPAGKLARLAAQMPPESWKLIAECA